MTVIAWDGKTIAADRKVVYGGTTISSATKIMKLKDGTIIAGEGDTCMIRALMKWYEDGCVESEWPKAQTQENFSRLVVVRDGKLYCYDWLPVEIDRSEDGFTAFGSGRELALGAMAAGANAIEAVKIASRFHTECGQGIDYVRVIE